MSLADKFGSFVIKDIIFYDERSFETFIDDFKKAYKDNIASINGKKTKGSGKFGFRTKEERDKMFYLKMGLDTDESNKLKIFGSGHRREIFGVIGLIRDYYEQNHIVAYSGSDTVRRESDSPFIDEQIRQEEEDRKSHSQIMAERISMWKNGTLPPPKYKTSEEIEK